MHFVCPRVNLILNTLHVTGNVTHEGKRVYIFNAFLLFMVNFVSLVPDELKCPQ